MNVQRRRRGILLALLLSAAGCSGASPDLFGAAAPDAAGGDAASAQGSSGGGTDGGGGDDSRDATVLDDAEPPTTGDAQAHDAGGGADGAVDAGPCGALGMPCTYDPAVESCPPFFTCNLAFSDRDAGNGVCLNAFDFPPACDAGSECSAGTGCLLASNRCMTALETSCACGTASSRPACGLK